MDGIQVTESLEGAIGNALKQFHNQCNGMFCKWKYGAEDVSCGSYLMQILHSHICTEYTSV